MRSATSCAALARDRNIHRNAGININSSRRDCFGGAGGSHNVAAPISEPFQATSTPPRARYSRRVKIANIRGRPLALSRSSDSIHFMIGSA
jgi:hypothetical protein